MPISLAVVVAIWLFATYMWSLMFVTSRVVVGAFVSRAISDVLQGRVQAGLPHVLFDFAVVFVVSIPVISFIAWYSLFHHVMKPWIQFILNIPPLAYVFLIAAVLGVSQVSKVTVIFTAAFLAVVIAIYQGVKGADTILIKATRVLDTKQKNIFSKITVPTSIPFVLIAARLNLSAFMTTLMTSEIVGGNKGVGMMIQQANRYYQMDMVLIGIIFLGITGIYFEKIAEFLERRFTGWQETIQQ